MGKKVHPISIRLGINKQWPSEWFSRINRGNLKKYRENLKEDWLIRNYLEKALKNAALEKVTIKRFPHQLNIVLHTARPGLVIGKSGKDIEILRRKLSQLISSKTSLKLDIQEIRKPDTHAALVARNIAEQIERRLPYRRVIKKALDKINLDKEIRGVKIKVAGRLNGAEIARSEWLSKGEIPLQTLKANIDFAQDVAHTVYGAIGIKVWLYKKNGAKIDIA